MSLKILSSLNSPPLVAATGCAVIIGLPFFDAATTASTLSLATLKVMNVAAFATNVLAVSIPGRIDGQQNADMRNGTLNPYKPNSPGVTGEESTPLSPSPSSTYNEIYSPTRSRTLVSPSGWAFAIWGPIYIGEAIFVAGQFLATTSSTSFATALPQLTAPFVTANILQSLWCASFRPSYNLGWKKYVSVGMLAGTAYSLSHVQAVAVGLGNSALGWYLLPLSLHFGWTTAATLVNLNGSVAMNSSNSDSRVIAVGHSSAVVATVLGIGITLVNAVPAYGLTIAWALAGCADGMKKRIAAMENQGDDNILKRAAAVQNKLCWAGSAACILASISAAL
mmetsp:Transcript_35306/g.43226  ORF Transcript_35306/g.43226 Transcript_35306/m.43226 type:complete len:337 (+) Transcript_35306:108-1118(+)|eukprot:CAMPEP_0172489264 /NCGR_PEP_ID=MMETSP1066-20121228/19155_1 /TAXON_ID=671091 /ORGANISM="Coscinodiscus wailesii, Strain CCMP2513" /LENGTH=336 /DNA_ID=CAMNT_0013256993 /DNA_START=148 /DNA_END=1158 /DNA_ORIENTATION=-